MTTETATGLQIQVLQENLHKALPIVMKAVAKQTTMPVTQTVLVEAHEGRLRLSATDLELSIRAYVGARIEAEGAICLPANDFNRYIAAFPPATVDLAVDGTKARLECARSKATVYGFASQDFPQIQPVDGVELSVAGLGDALQKVVFAASADDSRPVLLGVHFKAEGGKLSLGAADGFRVSHVEVPCDGEWEGIVPARACRELLSLLKGGKEPVTIIADEKRIRFSMTDVEVTAQLIQGVFPNLYQLYPSETTTTVRLKREALLSAARVVAVAAAEGNGTVRMYADLDGFRLLARADEVGEAEAVVSDAEVSGENGHIAASVRYLQDVAGLWDEFEMRFTTPSHVMAFQPAEGNDYHLVMPMFVQWDSAGGDA